MRAALRGEHALPLVPFITNMAGGPKLQVAEAGIFSPALSSVLFWL
jgi:hypothetical protein